MIYQYQKVGITNKFAYSYVMNVSQTEAVMRVLHAHLGKSTYHKKDGEKKLPFVIIHVFFCNLVFFTE